jgi:hypothetical protein
LPRTRIQTPTRCLGPRSPRWCTFFMATHLRRADTQSGPSGASSTWSCRGALPHLHPHRRRSLATSTCVTLLRAAAGTPPREAHLLERARLVHHPRRAALRSRTKTPATPPRAAATCQLEAPPPLDHSAAAQVVQLGSSQASGASTASLTARRTSVSATRATCALPTPQVPICRIDGVSRASTSVPLPSLTVAMTVGPLPPPPPHLARLCEPL